jgi:signal transduction histidine kinase
MNEAELAALQRELAYYKAQVDTLSREGLKNQYSIAETSNQLTQLRHGFAIIAQIQQSVPLADVDAIYDHALDLIIRHLHLDTVAVLTNLADNIYTPWLVKPLTNLTQTEQAIALPSELCIDKGTLFINSRMQRRPDFEPLCTFLNCPYLIAASYTRHGIKHILVGGRKLERSLMSYAAFTETDAFLLASLAAVINAIDHQITRQNELENERMRIARDMHDDLGSDLSKIAIFSQLMQNKADEKETVLDFAHKIKTTTNELVENLGNIVWTLNPENNSWTNLLAYLREFCSEYLEPHNLECQFLADQLPEKAIGHEMRKNVLMVTKEALRNIVKHAKATHVSVRITVANQHILFTIADDGVGFTEGRPFGNGLKNMQQRMATVGGNLTYTANAPHGTCISISLPLY